MSKINSETLQSGDYLLLQMQQLTRESGFPQQSTTQPVCAPPPASSWIRPCISCDFLAIKLRKIAILSIMYNVVVVTWA